MFEPEIDAVFSHYETDPKRAGIRCEETVKLRKERGESRPARRGAKPVVIQRDSSVEVFRLLLFFYKFEFAKFSVSLFFTSLEHESAQVENSAQTTRFG